MIYCCGAYYAPINTVFIESDCNYKDRKLEVLVCPKCGALKAVLTQFNTKTLQYEKYIPPRKKTAQFIRKFQEKNWFEIKIKCGTKGRAGFIFGINKEYKNGEIKQFASDFNGEKQLVKTIQPLLSTL